MRKDAVGEDAARGARTQDQREVPVAISRQAQLGGHQRDPSDR